MEHVTYQDYAVRSVRAAAILTTGYVAGTVIGVASSSSSQQPLSDDPSGWNHLALECDFTIGSLADVLIKIEFSDDNTNFYQISVGANSSGTITESQGVYKLTATGKYYIDVNKDFFGGGGFKTRYIKISAQGEGTVTNSSLAITAVLGVA